MKFYTVIQEVKHAESRPARGGWIEILVLLDSRYSVRSRPARGGGIEIQNCSLPP